jgi:hypothetical protein
MKGQERAKKVARELEVNFDENRGIVTPAIRCMQRRNSLVNSTPLVPLSLSMRSTATQSRIVATTEVTTGETTSTVDEKVASENHALAPPPFNSSYNGNRSSYYHNSGPNRANDRNATVFTNNAADRKQSHFSGEQHQYRQTDHVKLAMPMSDHFSSKDSKFQFSGGPNEIILEYIQKYKLAIREYDLSPSMQKDFLQALPQKI